MLNGLSSHAVFDTHLHIIDRQFPLVSNNGYLPEFFTVDDYTHRMRAYNLIGGAVVSGSFQGFDQRYLVSALAALGPSFVGVTQLPSTVTDDELLQLDRAGVRGVRFNFRRGGPMDKRTFEDMARRVYDLLGWHVELYIDARDLAELSAVLEKLSAVSVDHLGLSRAGLPILLRLAEKGVRVKASGFGRLDFEVPTALKDLYSANLEALMFGTDLPSTRAPREYADDDFRLVLDALGEKDAQNVFCNNARKFYRLG